MMRSIVLILCLALMSLMVNAQRITTSVKMSKDSVQIGEELSMTLSITSNQPLGNLNVDYSPLGEIENLAMSQDSTPVQTDPIDIEWLESPFGEADEVVSQATTQDADGKYNLTQTLRLRVWDFGAFRVPSPIYMNANKDTLDVMSLESPFLIVPFPNDGIPQDTTQMINPIENIAKENRNWKDFLWLIILIAVLLAGLLLAYFQSKIKRKVDVMVLDPVEEVKPKLPAHVIALDKLNKLKQERLWENNQVKEYQSKLTFAIREYLENRFEVQALESTTSEIVNDLEAKDFDTTYSESLTRILQVADLVKFAKATPDDAMHEQFLDEAFSFVEDTKSIEELINPDGDE